MAGQARVVESTLPRQGGVYPAKAGRAAHEAFRDIILIWLLYIFYKKSIQENITQNLAWTYKRESRDINKELLHEQQVRVPGLY